MIGESQMPESNVIDLSKVIGVYGLCNTGAVLVHAIDYPEDTLSAPPEGLAAPA